jgi:putative ABC transport system permease protein
VTRGIRSFTTLPYVFTTFASARPLVNAEPGQGSFTLVRLAPGSDPEEIRESLQALLPDAEVVSHQVFRNRSHDYWLFETGAGAGLIAGMVLAVIVGVVVVAQTLYASTKEHLNEFATLRALGASSGFIRKVILWQAVLSALMGYALGMVLAKVVTYLDAIDSEGFQEDMGNPPRRKIAIVITCDHPIHPTAQTVIDECKASAAARGIRLAVQKSKG